MLASLDFLRELNIWSVILRLLLAVFVGGLIGLERTRKRRPAGFRTYTLVCLGSALTMLLSQYEYYMLTEVWLEDAMQIGITTDVSRFGAQAINGIGFLGAGTILVTGRKEVKGMTTAACLWASACVGLAIGAGFYECVVLSVLIIFLTVYILPGIEYKILQMTRDMNVYVEFDNPDDVGQISSRIKAQGFIILEIDMEHGGKETRPSAVFAIRMYHRRAHTQVLASISEIKSVRFVDEI